MEHTQHRASGPIHGFLRGMGREILKVDRPSRHQVTTYTVVVLVTVVTMTVFVFGLDAAFSRAVVNLIT